MKTNPFHIFVQNDSFSNLIKFKFLILKSPELMKNSENLLYGIPLSLNKSKLIPEFFNNLIASDKLGSVLRKKSIFTFLKIFLHFYFKSNLKLNCHVENGKGTSPFSLAMLIPICMTFIELTFSSMILYSYS